MKTVHMLKGLSYIVAALIPISATVVQVDGNLFSDQKSEASQLNIRMAYPQGWNFFTKPPTDAFYMAYTKKDSEWSLRTNESSSLESLLGISRNVRSWGLEVGHLIPQIEVSNGWSKCNDTTLPCLNELDQKPLSIVNPVDGADLCGEAVFVERNVTPRSYRSITQERYHSTRSAHVTIKCESDQ